MGVSRENGCLDKLVSFCKPPGPPLQALGGGEGVRDVVLRGLLRLPRVFCPHEPTNCDQP